MIVSRIVTCTVVAGAPASGHHPGLAEMLRAPAARSLSTVRFA